MEQLQTNETIFGVSASEFALLFKKMLLLNLLLKRRKKLKNLLCMFKVLHEMIAGANFERCMSNFKILSSDTMQTAMVENTIISAPHLEANIQVEFKV
ncbi:hypothetical protein TNCT_714361 [Trichonephila clavata]|uniref:Uncharacterized protein n=1 Tax=Trichonephila clavata TaxID=2740835 RepID=A0A8X6LB57_TRICU|nr:hypothetical protein TNCT_714361 [Trichonephila clavata]